MIWMLPIWLILLNTAFLCQGMAQAPATPQKVLHLFDDLPIDNASDRSVLREGETAAEKLEDNVFIRADLSTQHCYVGEPILLQYKLYTAVQSRSELLKLPALNYFTAYSIPNGDEQPQYEEFRGRKMRVYAIAAWQLFPYNKGDIQIEPISVQHHISYQDANGSDVAYNGITQSNSLTIQVLELPPAKDVNFSGAVGDFSINSQYENDSIVAGESSHLNITVTGAGNFTDLKMPAINWPAHVQAFTAKESMEVNFERFPASGSKLFKIPFLVEKAGDYTIPATEFSFFNPRSKTYQSVGIPAKSIHVTTAVPILQPTTTNNLINRPDIWVVLVVSAFLLLFVFFMLRYSSRKIAARKTSTAPVATIRHIAVLNPFETLLDLDAIKNNDEYVLQVKECLTENFIRTITPASKVFKNAASELVSNCNYLLFSPGAISAEGRLQLSRAVRDFCNTYKQLIIEPSSLLN